MTITIDKFGRVLIPKPVRERLGLRPGAELRLDVHDEGHNVPSLELHLVSGESALAQEGALLVHRGAFSEEVDLARFIRAQRDGRAQRTMGLDG